jgi:hypothetical protein
MSVHPQHGDWIRGLTIRQPWATCILAGKNVENRSKPWAWRSWVLLHAGKQTDPPAMRLPIVAHAVRGRQLERSAVIGVARITDCHQDPDPARSCSPWAEPGAHHLVLEDVQELPLPVPADGALGLWKPSPDLLHRVLLQLPHLAPSELS